MTFFFLVTKMARLLLRLRARPYAKDIRRMAATAWVPLRPCLSCCPRRKLDGELATMRCARLSSFHLYTQPIHSLLSFLAAYSLWVLVRPLLLCRLFVLLRRAKTSATSPLGTAKTHHPAALWWLSAIGSSFETTRSRRPPVQRVCMKKWAATRELKVIEGKFLLSKGNTSSGVEPVNWLAKTEPSSVVIADTKPKSAGKSAKTERYTGLCE